MKWNLALTLAFAQIAGPVSQPEGDQTWKLTLALVLIGVGVLLMISELFIPSGGILSALALGAFIVAVGLSFWYKPVVGMWTLVGVAVALPVLVMALFYYWPRTPLGKKFILEAPPDNSTLASMQTNVELEDLRGRIGKAVSTLRPSGIVDFEGRRVDCVTEGMMVEAGQAVKCIEVKAGRVVVRPVDKPKVADLENADFG